MRLGTVKGEKIDHSSILALLFNIWGWGLPWIPFFVLLPNFFRSFLYQVFLASLRPWTKKSWTLHALFPCRHVLYTPNHSPQNQKSPHKSKAIFPALLKYKKIQKSYVLASVQMETKLLGKNILLIVAKIVRGSQLTVNFNQHKTAAALPPPCYLSKHLLPSSPAQSVSWCSSSWVMEI